MEEQRREWLREHSRLKNEVQQQRKQLEKMEAHEGEDGTAEDVAGQCALVDEIAAKQRRMSELHKMIYPK